jgi:hypothetical protein
VVDIDESRQVATALARVDTIAGQHSPVAVEHAVDTVRVVVVDVAQTDNVAVLGLILPRGGMGAATLVVEGAGRR